SLGPCEPSSRPPASPQATRQPLPYRPLVETKDTLAHATLQPGCITKRPTDHDHELGSLWPSTLARLFSEFRKVSYGFGKIRWCLSPSLSTAVLCFALLDELPHFTASPFQLGLAVFGWPIVVSHSSLHFSALALFA